MAFPAKTRKDKILNQLQKLSEDVKLSDVKFIVGASKNRTTESYLEEEKPRPTFKNKYELAKNIAAEVSEPEIEGDGEDEGISYHQSKKIQRHIVDFKAKGKLESFIIRQNIRRWRDIAQAVTKKIEEEEHGVVDDFYEKPKVMREDVGKQNSSFRIKKNLNAQNDFVLTADTRLTNKTNALNKAKDEMHGQDIKKSSLKPENSLKKFLPFCNNIVLLNMQKKNDK